MWTASIESKKRENDKHNVLVIFSNGTDTFALSFLVMNKAHLNSFVKSKLDELNQSDIDSVEIGPFVPVVSTVESNPIDVKLEELRKQKVLLDLDVITKDDPKYLAAVNAVKDELNK